MNTKNWPDKGALMLIGRGLETKAIQYAKEMLHRHELFDANNHPDYYFLKPEKIDGNIKIDEVRDLITWNMGKPQISKKKVAVISPLQAMNLQAFNALLKTLEELPQTTLFILVTDKPSSIPATIRSRCHKIVFRENNPSVAQPELKTQILEDLEKLKKNQENPVSLAERWVKLDVKLLLSWWAIILSEQIKASLKGRRSDAQKRFALLDAIFDAKRYLDSKTTPNSQLLFESLLIQSLDPHLNPPPWGGISQGEREKPSPQGRGFNVN